MGRDIELSCRCGAVRGVARAVSPSSVNRAVCYCDDCQAFLHHLQRADLLDGYGGTELVQVCPSIVSFDQGAASIRAVRLTEKGMFRWYASCCNTPLGNTLSPSVPLPFIGMQMEVFRGASDAATRDAAFGESQGAMMTKLATRRLPPETKIFSPLRMFPLLGRMLRWKVTGRAWPHPFFDETTREPKYPVSVLTNDERAALRPLTSNGAQG